MHRMCSLQQPIEKARIYAGCRGVKCARFTHMVTQFAHAAILPLICPGDPQLGFFCGITAAILKQPKLVPYRCTSYRIGVRYRQYKLPFIQVRFSHIRTVCEAIFAPCFGLP